MKNLKIKIDNILDLIVKYYIYGAIFGLVWFMLTTLSLKFINFINNFFIEKSFEKETKNWFINDSEHSLLHNIAFTIVLVKAYTILMEYAKTKHINLKYTLEIAIIAPIIEIIFNYNSYNFEILIFYWVLAISFSIIYLFFYENLQKVEKDYKNNYNKN